MTLNNPIVLFNLTVFGLGLEAAVERTDSNKWAFCISVQALVWSSCWEWGN